jgi:hypothetical protein
VRKGEGERASPISASARTMAGFFPPNSRDTCRLVQRHERERERQETFLKDGAAFAATNLPVAVPPVKEIAATSG